MYSKLIRFGFLLTGIILLQACENDIEKINLLNTSSDYPDVIANNIEVIYSDSSKVKVRLTAPELRQYNNAEKPYTEFPQGMHVSLYDDSLMVESEIQANYAKYYSEDKLWHATGNVIAKNNKTMERLDSEEMYWDEDKERIYSETYTRIENEDGTFYGQYGFTSNQSLTDYELIGSKGTINFKEDEQSR